MKTIWRNIIISTLLAIALYLFVFYSETTTFPNYFEQWIGIVVAVLLVNFVGLAMMYLNSFLNKYVSWNRSITIRFVIEVLAGITLTIIATVIFIYAYIANIYVVTDISLLDFVYDGVIKFVILSVVIIYGYSLINFSIFSFNQYSVGQIDTIKTDRIQLNLRFAALKSQLNPHFLFNALNTISSLIFIDTKLAKNYVRQLASTYDYILKTDNKRVISIKEELNMIKAYFFMQKTRFDNRIKLNINNNTNNIDGSIPPFTLQILVENALKHSYISDELPLVIEIFRDNNRIVIRNNINEKPEFISSINYIMNKQKESKSYKIGLSNIRERYSFLTNKEIEVKSNKHFTVSVPIITTLKST